MTDYDCFERTLKARFGANAADEARYQRDFFHVQQMRKESFGAYSVRYLRLLSKMAAIGKPFDSVTQIAKFVDGLQPGLRAEIS